MPTHDSSPALPPEEPPLVEVWLDVGEALRFGDRVLRVMDTDGEDTMLRLDRVIPEDDDETNWSELPR